MIWRRSGATRRAGWLAAAFIASGASGASSATPRASTAIDRDLTEVTVPLLEEMYRQRRYTVTEVTRWYLERIARHDHAYRAFLNVDAEPALRRAAEEDAEPMSQRRGALWGVPVAVKGNTSVAGEPTSVGWEGYLRAGHALIAPQDATLVKRLKAAGAVILGETNLPDFASTDTTVSTAGGRTGNAYDVRFSAGGSSGGTATAVAASFCTLGTGTDTANSIRQPAALQGLVGLVPTRGLVSAAGIHPSDWLRDTPGFLTRSVVDAAIALTATQGEDPRDLSTEGSESSRQAADYLPFLHRASLRGKRFGVPWFVLQGSPAFYDNDRDAAPYFGGVTPATRTRLMKAVAQLRAAGATVVIDRRILPESFFLLLKAFDTKAYRRQGVDAFLKTFGPAEFHSVRDWERVTDEKFPPSVIGGAFADKPAIEQKQIETDPAADEKFWRPRREALELYEQTMRRFHLDGFVYPSVQEPNYDELAPGARTDGPRTETQWVNMIGVPAVTVPGGAYPNGMPFGLEMSGSRYREGDLLGYAYAYERASRNRRPPVLTEPRRAP